MRKAIHVGEEKKLEHSLPHDSKNLLSSGQDKINLDLKSSEPSEEDEFRLEYKLTKILQIGEQFGSFEVLDDGILLSWKNTDNSSEIKLWDIESGCCIKSHKFNQKEIVEIKTISTKIILIVFSIELCEFDLEKCLENKSYKFGCWILSNIIFLPDNKVVFLELVNRFRDDRLQVFDLHKFKCSKTYDTGIEGGSYTLENINDENFINVEKYGSSLTIWHPERGPLRKIETTNIVFLRRVLSNTSLIFNNLRNYTTSKSKAFAIKVAMASLRGEYIVDPHREFADKSISIFWPLVSDSKYQDSYGKYFVLDLITGKETAVTLEKDAMLDAKLSEGYCPYYPKDGKFSQEYAADETAPKLVQKDKMLSLHLHPGACQLIKVWQQISGDTHRYQLIQVIRIERQYWGNQTVQMLGDKLVISSADGSLMLYTPETPQQKQVKWILETYQKILHDPSLFSIPNLAKMFKYSSTLYLFCLPYALAHTFRENLEFRAAIDLLIREHLYISASTHVVNDSLFQYFVDILLKLAVDKKITDDGTKIRCKAQSTATIFDSRIQDKIRELDKLKQDVATLKIDAKTIADDINKLKAALDSKARREMIFGVLKVGLAFVGGQILDLIGGAIDSSALLNVCPFLFTSDKAEELFNSGKEVILNKGAGVLLQQAGFDPERFIEDWSRIQITLSKPESATLPSISLPIANGVVESKRLGVTKDNSKGPQLAPQALFALTSSQAIKDVKFSSWLEETQKNGCFTINLIKNSLNVHFIPKQEMQPKEIRTVLYALNEHLTNLAPNASFEVKMDKENYIVCLTWVSNQEAENFMKFLEHSHLFDPKQLESANDSCIKYGVNS